MTTTPALDLDELERQAQHLRRTGRDRYDAIGAAVIALRVIGECRRLRTVLDDRGQHE